MFAMSRRHFAALAAAIVFGFAFSPAAQAQQKPVIKVSA